MSVPWLESRSTENTSIQSREFPRAAPSGTPSTSCWYFPVLPSSRQGTDSELFCICFTQLEKWRGNIVSVLGRDEGYMVKHNPLPEGVVESKALGNSWRQRVILDSISRVESEYGHYIILPIIRPMFTSLFWLKISPYTPYGVYCVIYPSLQGNNEEFDFSILLLKMI